MKILFIGSTKIMHFYRWINFLYEQFNIKSVVINIDCDKVGNENLNKDITVYDLHLTKRNIIRTFMNILKLKKIIKDENADFVNVHYLYSIKPLLLLNYKKNILLNVWGSDIFRDPYKNRINYYICKKALTISELIIGDSKYIMEEVYRKWNIDKKKLKSIYWGVDSKVYNLNYNRAKIRKKFNIDETSFVILSFRQWESLYNIDTIIKAVELLKSENIKVKFIVKGNPWNSISETTMQKYINESKIADISILLNKDMSYEEIAELIKISDTFISIPDTDSLALSLLEGMSCGSIPIVSNLDVNKEVIQDGYNGFMVNPKSSEELAKAIVKVYKMSNEERKKVINYNYNIIEKRYSKYKCFKEFYDLLCEVKKNGFER